jgi:hypothetical protein
MCIVRDAFLALLSGAGHVSHFFFHRAADAAALLCGAAACLQFAEVSPDARPAVTDRPTAVLLISCSDESKVVPASKFSADLLCAGGAASSSSSPSARGSPCAAGGALPANVELMTLQVGFRLLACLLPG